MKKYLITENVTLEKFISGVEKFCKDHDGGIITNTHNSYLILAQEPESEEDITLMFCHDGKDVYLVGDYAEEWRIDFGTIGLNFYL